MKFYYLSKEKGKHYVHFHFQRWLRMPNAVANYSSSFNRISLTHKFIKEHSSDAILTRRHTQAHLHSDQENALSLHHLVL